MRFIEYIVLPLVWGGLLLAALSAHEMQSLNQHSICGPWGCGPPTNALIALHTGWLVVLLPPLLYLPWRLKLPRRAVTITSLALIVVGIGGLLGIVIWQWTVWLPNASEWAGPYIWQRCGFVIATASDWPLVQLIFAGAGMKMISPPVRSNLGANSPTC